MTITLEEAERIAERAAKKALRDGLEKFGINPEEPLEVQKDMAHLRQQRQASEQVGVWVKRTLIVSFLSGGISLLVVGVKSFFGTH